MFDIGLKSQAFLLFSLFFLLFSLFFYYSWVPLEQLHQSVQKIPSILHKKPTFSILHYHFYKTPTSIYLLYTLFY